MKDATLKQSKKIISIFENESVEKLQAILSSGFLADIRDCDISRIDRKDFRKFLGLSSLLEFVGDATISATAEPFIAAEEFIRDISPKAKVKIGFIGDNLNEWFLGDDGKVESPIAEQILRYAQLKEGSVDKSIIAELGDEDKVETTLTEMFSLMEKQGRGQTGDLLVNGYANIFYIRDKKAALRAVYCYWNGDGWDVGADSVGGPGGWGAGRRVFSRNSA